ncbi:MAG: IS200/IS605 family transposase [Myxococcaceae bacterium]|nr:IS200/IS605 family transposase [Myxococcaceae bacterium]
MHFVFSTKNRHGFIVELIRNDLYAYLAAIAHGEGANVYEIGGIEDHVHILLGLPRTMAAATMAEKLKSNSSKWFKTKRADFATFAWQQGYGVFSVSQSQLTVVRQYIQKQKEHHRNIKPKDELRVLLAKHRISFDEKDL